MLDSLAYVVLISTKVISKITVTHISTILRLIFVDFDNPAQRKRCEFSKSYARAAMTTIHFNLIFAIFCRTIATIRNFAKLQPLVNVNPLVFLISLWGTLPLCLFLDSRFPVVSRAWQIHFSLLLAKLLCGNIASSAPPVGTCPLQVRVCLFISA